MGIGERLEQVIGARRRWQQQQLPGPLGDFYRAGGNAQLLAGVELGGDGLVIDAGGFKGDFTAEACWRLGARSLVLEPIPSFARELRARFAANPRVRVLEAGLGAGDGELTFSNAADGSSSFGAKAADAVTAKVLDAAQLVAQERPVSLLKLNIEGGEFDVLERLSEAGLLGEIRCLLIQFHRVFPEADERRDRIRAALAVHHVEEFCHAFVWERWRLRDAAPPRA